MAKDKKFGTAKRFGSRYGRTVRNKVGEMEHLQRKSYKCPFCHNEKVKRLASGIWKCNKCKEKFAGKAYVPGE